MNVREDLEDHIEPVPLPPLPLDAATVRWLTMLSRGDDRKAAEIVASMLRDIRVDDEAAHAILH